MGDRRDVLDEASLSLAWSLWGELGVSTWERRHQGWSVELEPLVAFTAFLAVRDRRLAREAIDWCISNSAFVSLSQFRSVTAGEGWGEREALQDLAATMMALTGRKWPGAERGRAWRVEPSGRSRLRELSEPSLFQLRLRAVFGVGARAELLRWMLSYPSQEWTVAQLGERIAYTQRQAAADLEMLASGGLLKKSTGGPSRYVLADPPGVARVLGELPRFTPRWLPMFQVLAGMLTATEVVSFGQFRDAGVEMARRLRGLEPLISRSGLPAPPRPSPSTFVADVEDWIAGIARRLASADPTVLPPTAKVPVSADDLRRFGREDLPDLDDPRVMRGAWE